MMLSVIRAISKIARERFENMMLLEGAFPEVKFSKARGWASYSLFDYSDLNARFMKLVDFRMKEQGLDERLGVFTRKHSVAFLAQVQKLVNDISEGDVLAHGERFRSFADGVRDSI